MLSIHIFFLFFFFFKEPHGNQGFRATHGSLIQDTNMKASRYCRGLFIEALTGGNYELEEKLHLYPGEAAELPTSLAKFMRCLLCL